MYFFPHSHFLCFLILRQIWYSGFVTELSSLFEISVYFASLNLNELHWSSSLQGFGWSGRSSSFWAAAVCVTTVAQNTGYSSNSDNMRSTSSLTEKHTTTPLCPSTSVRALTQAQTHNTTWWNLVREQCNYRVAKALQINQPCIWTTAFQLSYLLFWISLTALVSPLFVAATDKK